MGILFGQPLVDGGSPAPARGHGCAQGTGQLLHEMGGAGVHHAAAGLDQRMGGLGQQIRGSAHEIRRGGEGLRPPVALGRQYGGRRIEAAVQDVLRNGHVHDARADPRWDTRKARRRISGTRSNDVAAPLHFVIGFITATWSKYW